MTARSERPQAIVVGMDLHVRDGWSLLHALKHGHETRHVPAVAVHSPSAADGVHHGRLAGAIDIVDTPVTHERIEVVIEELGSYLDRASRSLLVVTSDAVDETSVVVALFGDMLDVEMRMVTSVDDAYAALDAASYDCVVVDLKLAGGSGLDVVKRMRSRKALLGTPVVVSTGADPTKRDLTRLEQYAQKMVVKYPSTVEQLIDQIALFLHSSDVALPQDQSASAPRSLVDDQVFVGKRILIVDDDARNVFALTSALEQHGIDVRYADSGEEGISILQREPEIDLVLMDVMMPGMDGYTAMREIRRMPSQRDLPVVALTAKAMPGDRENSLSAGASDYVTKPVDVERLLGVIRQWLP